MKWNSKVVALAIAMSIFATSAQAFTFDAFSFESARRFFGLGFGPGYHSVPCNPIAKHHYNSVNRRQAWPVVSRPVYPTYPYARVSHAPAHGGYMAPMASNCGNPIPNMPVYGDATDYQSVPAHDVMTEGEYNPADFLPTDAEPDTGGKNPYDEVFGDGLYEKDSKNFGAPPENGNGDLPAPKEAGRRSPFRTPLSQAFQRFN